MNASILCDQSEEFVFGVVERFRQVEEQLENAIGGQIDAVLGVNGQPYLLRTAQGRLLESVAAERRASQLHSSIINALPAPVALLNAAGVIVAVNQAWTQRAAHSRLGPGCEVGRRYVEVCGLDLHATLSEVERAQLGINQVLIGKIDQYTQEYSCSSECGTEWFKLVVSPLQSGITEGAVVMHVDVTDQKTAELESRTHAAFPSYNSHPVLAFSKGGRLVYRNRAATHLLEEFGGEILPADLHASLAECLTSGCGKLLETKLGTRTLSWSFQPIPDEEIVHCAATDVTELLSLEAQLRQSQKMETVGQLAGGIAHNFNNLLTVVIAHASRLSAQSSAPEIVLNSAARITEVAKRAADLVRQLLAFGRRQVMELKSLDLKIVLESTATILRQVLNADIAVRVEWPPNLPCVRADHMMLEQVLLNLAVNARDAMPEGGELVIRADAVEVSTLEARQQQGGSAGEFVRLTVRDTGCGMTPDVLAKVFEPFFTTKDVDKGTGLGLATVYGIMQQHGGWIEVRSELGRGTTFQIYLHRAPAPPVLVAEAENPSSQPIAVVPADARILLVDDEPLLRGVVIQILEGAGYEVVAAGSGPEAIQCWLARGGDINLLLADMQMPGGMSGRVLAAELRRWKPELPVILTSGYTGEMVGCAASLGSKDAFLQKPYPMEKLLDMIRCAMQRVDGR
ncbi:MAG: response regulator [Verrucomicrobia bacterium]|nr:response regulator [Verrucomicrobiota bacterium]MBV9658604.1 response regulator [Verrucomicrobiota bacterium]